MKVVLLDNCGIKNFKLCYWDVSLVGVLIGNWFSWENDYSGFFEVGFFEI